jgi:hypothetical protein
MTQVKQGHGTCGCKEKTMDGTLKHGQAARWLLL